MEKVTKLLFILLVGMLSTNVFSQDIIKTGLIRAQLTISPSYNLSNKQSYFYLHGNAEVYLDKKISISGEGYYYLGNLSSNNSIFDYNHSCFFGASYHFLKNNNDLYIGIQPGISITKLNEQENNLLSTNTGINPVFSTVIGYNFYVHKIFHFFIQSRLVLGEHNHDMHKNLNEIRFSAGLGFNL
jgi:hypothetical protein